ncbi:MAG TPA: sulfotransferase [Solirubrobacterales bacterium]|nr:sulfotransferase [Solirubrobacterales bacterium]
MSTNQAVKMPDVLRNEEGRPLAKPPPVLFVGGTGRSGTHVVAKLLGKHSKMAIVPVEVRFHVEPRGFPGLLSGEVTKDQFLRRLRGFWWRGFQTRRMRGLYRFVPEETFERAVGAFEETFDNDPEGACRALFHGLLDVRRERAQAPTLVEQSCDTVAEGAVLSRLFPEAKFIHVVRDGRDASASRVTQTRGLVYPRTRRQGLEWWEERIRSVDAGARAIPSERLLTVSLDEFLLIGRRALRPFCRFVRIYPQPKMKRFYRRRMSPELAHSERWRAGLRDRHAAELERAYDEIVAGLEADGVVCAPLLRRTLDRSRGHPPADDETTAFLTGDGSPLRVPA